MKTRATEINGR